jgi:transcriptional regulator with XRE-family HTH domain
MFTLTRSKNPEDAKERLRLCGQWLCDLRVARDLTQTELGAKVGGVLNTYISQVETGARRISPERYREWAEALDVDLRAFAIELLFYYDPITHRLLFGSAEQVAADGSGSMSHDAQST